MGRGRNSRILLPLCIKPYLPSLSLFFLICCRKKTETELSYLGISMVPFSEDIRKLLLMPLNTDDVEMKPDGKYGVVSV